MSSKLVLNDETVNKLQDLVDSFDDIPKIMNKINVSLNDSPTRYKVILPNSSHAVELALRGNKTVKATDPNCDSKKLERMANQAMKVLNQLSKIAPKKNKRNVKETSNIAENKLKYLINSGINIEKLYSQYDTNKTGKVSYKDFSDTLLNLSSGIDRQEAHELANSLDKSNIGAIDYKNILKSLQDIQHKEIKSNKNINQINQSLQPIKKSSLPVEPKQTFEYITVTNNDIISIHDLSPNNIQLDPSDHSNIPRRYFYNPVINKELQPYKSTNQAPYYTEFTKSELKKHNVNIRSRSAPVHRSRSQGIKLSTEKETKNPYKHSLTAKLLVDQKTTSNNNNNNNTNYNNLNIKDININAEDMEQVDLDVNPFYKLTEKQKDIKQTDFNLNTKMLENSLVHQLQGKISTLKHLLKKEDPTSSGIVTYPEFRTVLIKAGVNFSTEQVQQLYSSISASDNNKNLSNASYKAVHTNDKGIDIDSFVDQVQWRSTSDDFKHIQYHHHIQTNNNPSSNQDYSFSEKTKKQQIATIMKKVLHAKSKLVYPNHNFDYLDTKQHGRLDYNQLQDALQHMNANLTPQEYSVLYEHIPKSLHNGIELVEMNAFHDSLVDNVNKYNEVRDNLLNERMQQKKYSNSYKSSNDLQLTSQNIEYAPLCHNKKTFNNTFKNNQRWNSICDMLRNQPTTIIYAFSKEMNQNASELIPTASQFNDIHEKGITKQDITDINIKDIRKNLRNVGINLGDTDYIQLMNHLQLPSSEDTMGDNQQSISLERFCETVNIPLTVTNKNKIVVSKSKEMNEYGIFCSSLKSLGSDDNYSSSYCSMDNNLTTKDKNGPRRVSLATALLQYPPHEPSKFWDLTKSSDSLFPSPMPSLRESFLPGQQPSILSNNVHNDVGILDNISAMKGLIKLNGAVSHSLSEHISNTNATERMLRSRSKIHVENIQSQTKAVKRSLSAPPRSSYSNHNFSSQMTLVLDGQQELQDLKHMKSNDAIHKLNHHNNDISSPYISKLNTAASVARWASSSLSDYFDKREMIRNNTPNEINSSDSTSNTNTTYTPNSKQLSSLRKIFVTQHNTTSSSRDGNAGQSIHSQAPFATD